MITSSVETRALPVQAGKKYRLQIVARVDGDFVVEKNARAHILTLQNGSLSSGYKITFQDDLGEEIPALGAQASRGSWMNGFFLTKNAYPYVMVFYAPENAASAKVVFQANGKKTYLSSLQLVAEETEETINVNPDFRYGELNYCGWKPSREGRLYKRPDGETVLNTGYSNLSPSFPLSPESKYHMMVIGEAGSSLHIEYLDKNGKTLAKSLRIAPTPDGAEMEFVPLPGTVMGRVSTVHSQILQEIRIVKMK